MDNFGMVSTWLAVNLCVMPANYCNLGKVTESIADVTLFHTEPEHPVEREFRSVDIFGHPYLLNIQHAKGSLDSELAQELLAQIKTQLEED